MDTEERLVELGLTQNESKVYISLLKTGETKVAEITKQIDINRSLLYRILESLIKKNLISSVIKENITYFSVTSPLNLKRFIEEKQENLDLILPELLALKPKQTESMAVEIYSELKGIKTMLRDQLEGVKEFYVLGAGNEFASMTQHFYEQYYRIRIERKILQKVLFKEEAKERAKNVSQSPYSEVRILNSDYKVPLAIVIYRNKVAFISWTEKKVIVITSNNITKGFKEQFELLWKTSQKI